MKKIISFVLSIAMILTLATGVCAASNEVKVTVNGSTVAFTDAKPIIKDGRTLVPLRPVFEKLGCNVEWNDSEKTACISKNGNTLKIKIKSSDIVLNNKKLSQKLDVSANLIDSRTYIPLRYPAQALGYSVSWNESTRTVSVAGKGPSMTQAYIEAETIFGMISNDSGYFNSTRNLMSNLEQSLKDMDKATQKANAIYDAGFLAIDITNMATGISAALKTGGNELYEAIIDAEDTMLSYANPKQSMSVSEYFTTSGYQSAKNGQKMINYLESMYKSRKTKGYFSYDTAVSFATCYYMSMIDRETCSTAVSVLLDNSATGILSGIALTAKKFAFRFLPDSLGTNIENLATLNSSTISHYCSTVKNYQNKLEAIMN